MIAPILVRRIVQRNCHVSLFPGAKLYTTDRQTRIILVGRIFDIHVSSARNSISNTRVSTPIPRIPTLISALLLARIFLILALKAEI